MAASTRVVVSPADMLDLAGRFDRVGDDCRQGTRRISAATERVGFNRFDPGFGVASFEINRAEATARIQRAAEGWRADAALMAQTHDQAVAADAMAAATAIDDLSARIVSWSGTENDPLLDTMARDRTRLLDELTGGSAAAATVLGAYLRRGGSVVGLLRVAAEGDTGVADAVQALVAGGDWASARDLDEALSVARLVVASGMRIRKRRRRADPIAHFDRLAATGVDLAVAANAAMLGIELPTVAQLSKLSATLTTMFRPGGSIGRISSAEQAWLPFSIRMAVQGVPAEAQHGHDGLRSSIADERFQGGADAPTTEVLIIGELGRAGLTRGSGALAGRLATLATDPVVGADLRLHGHIADVLAEASNNLDAAFFAQLGSPGTRSLPGVVMAAFHPLSTPSLSSTDSRLKVLGAYGDAMANVDRRGELPFSARDLLAGDDFLHSPAHLLVGDEPFSKTFALEAAHTAWTEATPNHLGAVDPRAVATARLATHGPAATVELFDLLGDGYLDTLLWPNSPVRHDALADPVYRLLAPVLDNPSHRPPLSAEIVNSAVRRGTSKLEFDTAEIIQHAMLADPMLLAPTEGHRLGGARVELNESVSPVDVVSLIEQIMGADSGGGLIAYSNTVITAATLAAASSPLGYGHLSEDQQVVTSEILGGISAASIKARSTAAHDVDYRNANIKLWGPAVFTGLGGALVPAGPLAAGAIGVTGGVLTGVGTDVVLPTDHFERLGWIVANEQGATSTNIVELMARALVEGGSISQSDLDAANAGAINFEDITIVLSNGSEDRDLREWRERFGAYEQRMSRYEEAYLAAQMRTD